MTLAALHPLEWDGLEGTIERLRSSLDKEWPDHRAIESQIANDLGLVLDNLHPSARPVLANALSDVQVKSKLWLLNELFWRIPPKSFTILVLGGWCGVLPWLAALTGRGAAMNWISIDADPEVCSIGKSVFGGTVSNLSFVCRDIYGLDYRRIANEKDLIVVNTICEHLPRFSEWCPLLPPGVLTVLQSNNFRGCPDHVNCVDSAQELVEAAKFTDVMFQGALPLSIFTRFMLIGRP